MHVGFTALRHFLGLKRFAKSSSRDEENRGWNRSGRFGGNSAPDEPMDSESFGGFAFWW